MTRSADNWPVELQAKLAPADPVRQPSENKRKTKTPKQTTKRSALETGFLNLWQTFARNQPAPVEQHKFHPTRKWLLDMAWPPQKVAVELEGGLFVRGRHSRGAEYSKDCEKHRALVLMGWALLRYTNLDLRQRPMQVVEEVCKLLDMRNER